MKVNQWLSLYIIQVVTHDYSYCSSSLCKTTHVHNYHAAELLANCGLNIIEGIVDKHILSGANVHMKDFDPPQPHIKWKISTEGIEGSYPLGREEHWCAYTTSVAACSTMLS